MSIIAVDVDLTVVDSLTPWMEWFKQFTDIPVLNKTRTYNLVPEMKEILAKAGGIKNYVDPLSFWRHADLYDKLQPVEGSVEALQRAKDGGETIVFVSSCFPEHTQSKINFLKRCFPFADGFIATHEKHYVAYGTLIDDKLEHMELGFEHRYMANHILFTGIRADGFERDREQYQQMSNWDDYYR
jgi:5'(3')-deoxyribonucleotidase